MQYLQYFIDLGASVVMPIILTIIAVLLGAKFGKSLRAGLIVGVGFIGLNLVIGLLSNNLGPAVQAMVKNYGLKLSVIDVGWPAAAAIAYATKIGAVIIPIALIVNVVMLVTKTTQTVNIDVWNFWHYAFSGSVVSFATNSIVFGMIAAAMHAAITLILADWTVKGVEEYCGLPGVSMPHGLSTAYVPFALIINKGLDYVPGINKVKIDADTVQKKFGVFGEPIIVGTVLGAIIGIFARYDLKGVCTLAISMGAALILIPKMSGLLMEGLIPISDAAAEFIEKRFKSARKLYIGLDSAVGIGHPTTLAVSLVLVPLAVLIAIILPGNQFLPFADLAVLPFVFVLIVPITKGDFLRTFIIGVFVLIFGFWISTDMAPFITKAATEAKFDMPKGATLISSICDGSNPVSWIFLKMFELRYIGTVIMGAVTVALALINRKRIVKQEVAAQ